MMTTTTRGSAVVTERLLTLHQNLSEIILCYVTFL